MLNRDSVIIGLLVGFALPFVGYALILSAYEFLEKVDLMSNVGMTPNFRERTVAIMALCLNMIPMTYWSKKRLDQSMRGMVVPIFFYVIAWFYFFGKIVL